ncbi:hypothetical protein [Paenibacillus radicis (ex Gao et al. 2016)]|uniref:Uncharacterized protein n=1 Tax=Paenibacillus radicis (ex Gao et al. 2016) TaxID=1737354 RepID=A0A917H2X0_9BACL|nr:hypothetical protein [Paenibacillus radicis (ex Gao et al. 2016)]GGG65684.1 hypothetical protein GCM10010918_19990 [Paenibacillus radicis (ex Gao et al. 2016)]
MIENYLNKLGVAVFEIELSEKYILNNDELKGNTLLSEHRLQKWGVQSADPDKFFKKEVSVYKVLVDRIPYKDSITTKQNIYLIIVENEVIGGYVLEDNIYHSLHGETLAEIKGVDYASWKKRWSQ